MFDMDLKTVKMTLGKYRTLYNRLTGYVGIVNTGMIFYIFIQGEPLGYTWYVWLIFLLVGCFCIVVFDVKMVIEGDGEYTFNKIPSFVKLKKDVERIREILEKEGRV